MDYRYNPEAVVQTYPQEGGDELVIQQEGGKFIVLMTYDQAINNELLDQGENPISPIIPELNGVHETLEEAQQRCSDIIAGREYKRTPYEREDAARRQELWQQELAERAKHRTAEPTDPEFDGLQI